ncbi:phage tail tape measure protein [Acinetobacter johnsonii]|uniref:phage tail tape measure protein n=1 Tax=Acinetobacter johnsonii TaxID=40214 RepID=UPI00244CBCEA|nr:phage tail tape measure protein [Acinetobacter johnsonii]MDH0837100.1 phage tail tape measure protein [Acinetobacter johnsonii]MDH0839372.1 phage tail tape measure protein [Acinetobacter johnsonii]
MSTKLGTLTLDLVTKIGNFIGPVKDGEKQVKVSFENMRQHVNTYGAALVAMGAGAVTALAGMAYSTSEQAVELEKFAFRANTTTQEFQKMAAGAGAYGIEQDKLSDMMKDFNEKLGELTAIGAGGGVDFFEQIAMKTEGSSEAAQQLILDMQKLSGPEALQMYVNKLEEAGVTQQQMSFYLESMASDLTDLYPLLANGGEGLKLYADMAERAGIIMTDQTIESAKALKDQVYMLDLQMQGAKNQLMQAVIPAFVDIAEAFFGGSEQGVQFEEVAEGISKTLKVLASIAIGAVTAIQLVGKALGGLAAIGGAVWNETDWYEMNPIGIAKAAYEARGEIAALTSEIKGDMHETIMGAADRLDKMWNSGTSKKSEQLRGVRELGETIHNTNSGLGELADKQNGVAKAVKQTSKTLADQNRILQERNRILYDYSAFPQQMEMDLNDEVKRLTDAGMSDFIPIAKARYAEEKKLAEMQFGWEISEHRFTEKQKLDFSYGIKRQEIIADTMLTEEQQKAKLQALRENFKLEESAFKISQQKQLLETKRNWMSATEYAQEYYALVREEILNTASYSPEKKEALLQQASSDQNIEQSYERDNAISDYRGVMGFDESPLIQQFEVLDKMRELDLLNEEAYQNAKLQLQMQSTASYMEGMFGGFAELVDENSKTYAVLFAAQRAFAVAQAMLNIPAAYSKAYDAVVGTPYIGPYIAPVVGAAAAALQVAQAAKIKGVSLTGMAHDGIDNVPREGTWLLDKGERVLNARQNKDLTSYLNQMGSQSQKSQPLNNNLRVIMVKDESEAKDMLYSADGEKAFLYHMKRNKSKV